MTPSPAPSPVTLCAACGRPFTEDARKATVGGRPKVYCDSGCKDLYHWTSRAEVMIERMAERYTPERWAALRRQLWGALNGRAWNRGVPRDVVGRPRAPWKAKG